MLTRDKVIIEATDRCLQEMYNKAQPKGNYYHYMALAKRGELDQTVPIYERHFLPEKEYEYIKNKYINAYGIDSKWEKNIDFLVNLLEKQEIDQEILSRIQTIKNRCGFNTELNRFNWVVCLGASPTCNPETVKKYWKTQGKDIELDLKEGLTEDDYYRLDR